MTNTEEAQLLGKVDALEIARKVDKLSDSVPWYGRRRIGDGNQEHHGHYDVHSLGSLRRAIQRGAKFGKHTTVASRGTCMR